MNEATEVFFGDKYLPTLFKGGWAAREFVFASRGKLIEGRMKRDKTFVSFVDEEAERIALPYLLEIGLQVTTEESGIHGASDGDYIILLDPVDGTIDYLADGSNNTIILSVLNRNTGLVEVSMVIEVVSGMVRFAVAGKGTYAFIYRGNLEVDLVAARRCRVWEGELSHSTRVLVDFAGSFEKAGYPTVPHEQWCEFTAKLYAKTVFANLMSNGMHYGIFSGGGARIAGAITTALGGPWDVPVVLGLEAGGYARAFSTADNILREVNPLNVSNYNYLVMGNSPKTVEVLADLLVEAVRPR